jgi:ADP-ribose pyrophosphatase
MNEDLFQLGIKVLITNPSGKILLLKVNPKKLKNFNGEPYYDIPGGRIHRGSTIEETLKREVLEETGITEMKNWKPFAMTLANIRIPYGNTDTGLILSVYVCEIDNSAKIILSDEHTEYNWFASKEAGELLKVKYPKEFTQKIAEMR